MGPSSGQFENLAVSGVQVEVRAVTLDVEWFALKLDAERVLFELCRAINIVQGPDHYASVDLLQAPQGNGTEPPVLADDERIERLLPFFPKCHGGPRVDHQRC